MSNIRNDEVVDLWGRLRFFLGEWQGTGSGKIGESEVQRSCKLILNEQFIRIKNRSVYPPQEKNPGGEVHDDLGFLSFDKTRGKYILREFHVEGFVNQYVQESWDEEGERLVLVTESIENISPGWQARVTYEITGENAFRETFDLAGPGQEWECYIINEFERVET